MTDERDDRDHEFSSGQGFSDPYEGFDIDPPEFEVDADEQSLAHVGRVSGRRLQVSYGRL